MEPADTQTRILKPPVYWSHYEYSTDSSSKGITTQCSGLCLGLSCSKEAIAKQSMTRNFNDPVTISSHHSMTTTLCIKQ